MNADTAETQRTRHHERLIPHTGINRLSRRALEMTQDVIVVGLVLVLFVLMSRTLVQLARDTVDDQLDFRPVIAEVLFMLVMVELVRLLLVYLREHHVAVDFMVELGIVSTLREIVLRGVVDLPWEQIAALSSFLLALGLLLRFGDLRLTAAERATDRRLRRSTDEREQPVHQVFGAN
ncbi:MAG: hypothetical protein QOJ59_1361 [Thermomicrobiales bacterium]|jgi:uncharacterized membrane protein (DUF373 family)|nr:hypothetical protein [Thermomicrobiales bacterium]